MVDRIDIMIEVPKVKVDDFTLKTKTCTIESSETIALRVKKARDIQLKRFHEVKITSNSQMTSKEVEVFCVLDSESEKMMKQALQTMNLSARAYFRVLKLARTIADLEESQDIKVFHIAEALSYRKGEN